MILPRGPRTRVALEVVVGALALLVAGAGIGLLVHLRGGGTQPEDVLPAGALAFARLDLDPSPAQKLAVYALARELPGNRVRGSDTVKEDLLTALLAGTPVDYPRDVAPWLGDRAGVAVLPRADGPPVLVGALQYRDRSRARQGLSRVPGVAHAFVDGSRYVLLGADRAAVEDAARASEHLSDDEAYTDAVDALGGDQVAIAWGDLARLATALPGGTQRRVEQVLGAGASGTVVLGAHVEDGAVEVVGRASGLVGSAGLLLAGSVPGTGLAGELPGGVVAAASATRLGASLQPVFDELVGFGPGLVLRGRALALGLSLPGDLVGALGEEVAVGLTEDDGVVARARNADRDLAARAVGLLEPGASRLLRSAPGGVLASLDPASLELLLAPGPLLREDEEFGRAVPDAVGAGLVAYADGPRLVRRLAPEQQGGLLSAVRSVGLTVRTEDGRDGPVQRLRLRLVLG